METLTVNVLQMQEKSPFYRNLGKKGKKKQKPQLTHLYQLRYLLWYTGRDSNPQPSEPESDALSIEPPVHLLTAKVL